MAVKRCSLCALNYPTAYGGLCLQCDGKLDSIDGSETMSEEEFNERRALVRLRAGDDPETLSEKEKNELDSDLAGFLVLYDELDAEARRRGARWSAADILEERLGRAA